MVIMVGYALDDLIKQVQSITTFAVGIHRIFIRRQRRQSITMSDLPTNISI
ncbi:hypothetical protein CFter6_1871 [Collimonas fungivorans]|uniref:Uncharacterized protein n=1 Tax=Collimonas fungivorans TaxID=158899 RepID=A0A127P9T9_9BURK|nr:hypothetical protein CFter6_1871 [Collimonas fungivorans]